MKVKQIYEIMNDVTTAILGQNVNNTVDENGNPVEVSTNVLKEDLSNLVDVGKEFQDAMALENFCRTLNDRIAKTIFVNRPYKGNCTSVMMDSWEYGSILQKIAFDALPEATENPSWNMTAGDTVEQTLFTPPKISSKFFNSKLTFEIPMSYMKKQVKSALTSVGELNSLLSMIETGIKTSVTIKLDSLISRTINHSIGNALCSGGLQAINLYKEFKELHPNTPEITIGNCISNPDFIRFCNLEIQLWSDRMTRISKHFNTGAKDRFTPKESQHMIALSEFAKASKTYLESNTYHKELVSLTECETVPYWQGSGNTYAFNSNSKINVKLQSGEEIVQDGILAIIFDRNALGVTNLENHVETFYVARGEYYNNWYKHECGLFNDYNENTIVFYVSNAGVE